jgi:anhydro-N-acetylmuramic acid kinase
MSGTSLDGIDVAIVDISGRRFSTVAFQTIPYPAPVRKAILGVCNAETHTAIISQLHFLLGDLYASAILQTCERHDVPVGSLELVGCHGQTIFHQGAPISFLGRPVASTLQIGEASIIAERTGLPVVCDFRPRDIAAGGRGAPLVPYVDYLLFRHKSIGRVALNIGGIANITAIPPAGTPESVVAFDTGPGNMVIDALVSEFTRGRWHYDRDGAIASRGRLGRDLLTSLLRDPYYRLAPPKTAGREQYGRDFADRLLSTGLAMPDLIATATVLTAATIAKGIRCFVPSPAGEVIVSGGGAHNPRVLAYLAAFLPGTRIRTSSELGIDVDAKEAVAFAVLAYETWRKKPANLPSATGARHPVVLGKIVR